MTITLSLRTLSVLLVASVATASAQSAGMLRQTGDGGGTSSAVGGGYELAGTIGQTDVGQLSGNGYTLAAGFWLPIEPGDYQGDGTVDLTDTAELVACLTGPAASVDSACSFFDVDGNGRIDLADVSAVQAAFTGD